MNKTTRVRLFTTIGAVGILAVSAALIGFGVHSSGTPLAVRQPRIVVGGTQVAPPLPQAAPLAKGPALPTDKPVTVAGIVVAKLGPNASTADVAKAAGVAPSAVTRVDSQYAQIAVPSGSSADQIIAAVQKQPGVAFAEPLHLRQLTYTPPAYSSPSDPAMASPTTRPSGATWESSDWWVGPDGLDMVAAWQRGLTAGTPGETGLRTDGHTIRVGVIDSGFYLTHPDRGNVVSRKDLINSWDGVSLSSIKTDTDVTPAPHGSTDPGSLAHGTCTAGEIAAATDNGVGVAGAGWDTQVYMYKVMGVLSKPVKVSSGQVLPVGSAIMPDYPIAQAIKLAANDGCKVISMSLGAPGYSQELQDAVTYARSKGSIVVAAVGNEGYTANPSTAYYPAASSGVLGVGSFRLSGSDRTVSSFSNRGYGLDIFGPGESVWGLSNPTLDIDGGGTDFRTGYGWWDGTSMATPAVAAGLAYLWRAAPALTGDQILSAATSTRVTVGGSAIGALDVDGAYQRLVSMYPLLGQPEISVPATSASASVKASWPAVPGTAVTYDVYADGALTTAGISATSATFTLPTEGRHVIRVAPHSRFNWADSTSESTAAVITDFTPTQIKAFGFGNGAFAWYDTETNAVHTSTLEIDSAAPVTVDGDTYTPSSLAEGSHAATLTVTDALGRTDSRAIDFTVPASATPVAPTLGVSPGKVVDYPATLTLKATSPASLGGFVTWQSSPDGVTWTWLASQSTDGTSAAITASPSKNTRYRVVAPGTTPSAAVAVSVHAQISRPYVKPGARAGHATTISGRIDPRHTPGTKPALVIVQHKIGAKWVTVLKSAARTSDGYAYSLSWTPKVKGTYRVETYHSDAGHAGSYSLYRSVTVK